MSDFERYLSDLSFGLKTLSNDIAGIIKNKKNEGTNEPKVGFKSMMSSSRFVGNDEKNKGVDPDVDRILKSIDKLFGG